MSFGYELPEKLVQTDVERLHEALLPGVPVYLSVDTDAFDPTVAPGVSHPAPGGLSWADAQRVLAILDTHGSRLLAADWMEHNPRFDTAHSLTARGIILQLSSLLQLMGEQVARERRADALSAGVAS